LNTRHRRGSVSRRRPSASVRGPTATDPASGWASTGLVAVKGPRAPNGEALETPGGARSCSIHSGVPFKTSANLAGALRQRVAALPQAFRRLSLLACDPGLLPALQPSTPLAGYCGSGVAPYGWSASDLTLSPAAALPQPFRLRVSTRPRPLTDKDSDRDPARREHRVDRP
jgi:hypothetical protein